ncbi:MAG: MFS transporter [Chloroflexi bacterium]|nr:MFS transporter [Chloroflexota bacterium]
MNSANHSKESSRKWLILILISLASFMGALDATIVNISLPTMSKYFQCDVATVSWVAMAYLLVLSGTLITFGRVADIRGYKRIYLAGFAIFTIGSLLCGLSSTIYLLIGFRVLQGVGAAMLQAIGGAMVVRYLPEKIRGTAFGVLITFAAVGLAAGTPLGGLISQFYSWHWIFFINVPVGIIAIILGLAVLPRDTGEFGKGKFDISGACLLLVALASLIFFLNMGSNIGWLSWLILISIIVSLATWAGFIFNEKRTRSPLIELSLFRDRNFTMAITVALLILLVGQGSWYAFPFYLELEKGFATNIAGLILLVPAIFMMVCGPIAGLLSDRIGSRPICVLGSAVLIAAFLMFALMGAKTGLYYIIIALALEGIGIGLIMPANFNRIMGMSVKGNEGVMNSLVTTVRNVGAVIGIAVFTLIFLSVIASEGISPAGITAHSLPPKAFGPGFHAIFLFGAVLGGVLLVLNLTMREKQGGSTPR